jgi:hypothetical protein
MNQQLKVAFRISLATTKEPYAISAWLRKGELQASEINVGIEYSDKLLRSKLPAMKELMRKKPDLRTISSGALALLLYYAIHLQQDKAMTTAHFY